jgi:hypothetical protein
MSIEQGDFAEDLTGVDQVEYGVFPLGRAVADLDRAGAHRKKAVARVALGEDRRTGSHSFGARVRGEPIDRVGSELSEQRMGAKNRPLVERLLRNGRTGNHGAPLCVRLNRLFAPVQRDATRKSAVCDQFALGLAIFAIIARMVDFEREASACNLHRRVRQFRMSGRFTR